MVRVWIALTLLLCMVGLSCFGLFVLSNYKTELVDDIEDLMAIAEGENDPQTAELAKELCEKWIIQHHTLCRYVRHAQLDQVTLAMARLEPLARHNETGELTAELMRCKILLEDIWESERPLVRNIV